KRLAAGLRLLELRERVEAGEAGDASWWEYYDKHLSTYRSREDAEKLLAIASAEDAGAAAEEERRKACESMAEMRKRRAANNGDVSGTPTDEWLEREARVEAILNERKREKMERDIQRYDSQVKDYLVAIKTFDQATAIAIAALRKFSPEARTFTKRKLKAV